MSRRAAERTRWRETLWTPVSSTTVSVVEVAARSSARVVVESTLKDPGRDDGEQRAGRWHDRTPSPRRRIEPQQGPGRVPRYQTDRHDAQQCCQSDARES